MNSKTKPERKQKKQSTETDLKSSPTEAKEKPFLQTGDLRAPDLADKSIATPTEIDTLSHSDEAFPIVGIGASAGGGGAVSRFLDRRDQILP